MRRAVRRDLPITKRKLSPAHTRKVSLNQVPFNDTLRSGFHTFFCTIVTRLSHADAIKQSRRIVTRSSRCQHAIVTLSTRDRHAVNTRLTRKYHAIVSRLSYGCSRLSRGQQEGAYCPGDSFKYCLQYPSTASRNRSVPSESSHMAWFEFGKSTRMFGT